MDEVSRGVAEYVVGLGGDDSAEAVVEGMRARVIDTVGCALAGSQSEAVGVARSLADHYRKDGAASARIWVSGERVVLDYASFANAVMIRSLDYNDTYIGLDDGGHPSDVLGAIVAAAEMVHATGAQMLTASIAAYEIFGAFLEHMPVRDRGWDHGLYTALASAVGVGKLLSLDLDAMTEAVSLAVVPNVPTRESRSGELTMWKGCATAASARSGVFAALLASRGMRGPSAPFQGVHGIGPRVTGVASLPPLGDRAAKSSAVLRTHVKSHPVEFHLQAPGDAALRLANSVRPDQLASMRVRTYWTTFLETASEQQKWDPQSRETADHSLPYVIAVALQDRRLTPASFFDGRVRDPTLRPLMGKIEVVHDQTLTDLYPGVMRTVLEARTTDGRVVIESVDLPRGHIENPMTTDDIIGKFTALAEPVLGSAVAPLLDALLRLEEIDDVATLVDLVVSPVGAL